MGDTANTFTAEDQAIIEGRAVPEAAPAEEGQQPAPAEGGQEAAPVEQKPVERVPLPELLAERKRRKAAELEIARLKGQYDEATRRAAPADPQKLAFPNIEQDPIAALREMREWKAAIEGEREQQAKLSQFAAACEAEVSKFRAEKADYDEAYRHLFGSRIEELRTMRYSDDQIRQAVASEEMAIAAHALQNGVNPAEIIYDLATKRGYKAAAAAPAAAPAADRIAVAARGQASGRSLSNAPGGASGAPTVEALLAMSDKEFAKVDLQKYFGV